MENIFNPFYKIMSNVNCDMCENQVFEVDGLICKMKEAGKKCNFVLVNVNCEGDRNTCIKINGRCFNLIDNLADCESCEHGYIDEYTMRCKRLDNNECCKYSNIGSD